MRSVVFKIYVFIAFIYLNVGFIYSENYNFRGITKSDGLSDLLVNVIYKDSLGYVWLGTGKGLDRFDGVRIKHYPFKHNLDEQRIRINTICETSGSQIWAGNAYGLWKLDKVSGSLIPVFHQMINNFVNALFYDGVKYLYIGTNKGLYISDTETINQILIDDDAFSSSNDIRGITQGDDGLVWLIVAGGLIRFNPETQEIKEYNYLDKTGKTASFRNITHLKDALYIGTFDKGIIHFDIPTGKFSDFLDLGSSIISSISTDGDDVIYVSTDGNGVFFISHSENKILESFRHHPNEPESIRSNSIYSLLVDNLKRIWIGFYQDGFDYSYYQSGLFQTYKFPPYFDSANLTVRSFVINGNQKLVGTRDGLYFIDEGRREVRKFDRSTLQSDLILSLTLYDNEYYIGTYDAGLYVLDPKTIVVNRIKNGSEFLGDGHIFCFQTDKNNNLWIGTSKGVVIHNPSIGRAKILTSSNSQLPEGNVYEIFFDSTGKGWICCENGMALVDPASGDIRTNVFPESFFHKEKIRTIYEDHRQKLYFFSEKGSLFESDLNMKSFSETDWAALKHVNMFMSIIEDKDNCLWLASDGGLIRLCNENYEIYNYIDGIPTPIFTNNSIYKDKDDTLWFGNSKGLLHIHPDKVNEKRNYRSRILLADVLVNGKPLAPIELERIAKGEKIKLSPRQNALALKFTTLSYSNPQFIAYEYKLGGVGDGWTPLNIGNELSLYNLRPGRHRISVRFPGDEDSVVSFDAQVKSTNPYFYFIFVLLISFSAVVIFYLSLDKKRQIKNGQLLENPTETISIKEDEKYKMSRMDDTQCEILLQRLNRYMDSEKPYVNPGLRIGDLADALDISSHTLSYLFSQHLDVSYYDYVNEFRIAEFKRIIVEHEDSFKYTLDTLANMSGFSSRTSFFRSFKKRTGLTPNEYIKNLTRK